MAYNQFGAWVPDPIGTNPLGPAQAPFTHPGPAAQQWPSQPVAPQAPAVNAPIPQSNTSPYVSGSAANPNNPYEYAYSPVSGSTSAYNTSPASMTALYQTTGGGGATPTGGQGSLTPGAYEQQQQTQLESILSKDRAANAANLQAEAERRRLGYLSTVTGQQSPQVGPQGGPSFDENAARTAAFARAKEQAGSTALASLKALQDVMAESGKTGSSIEAQGISNILGGAGGAVNNFTRTQLIQDLNRAADIADRNQQNAITQRGQNLSLIPSLMGLITATGGAY